MFMVAISCLVTFLPTAYLLRSKRQVTLNPFGCGGTGDQAHHGFNAQGFSHANWRK